MKKYYILILLTSLLISQTIKAQDSQVVSGKIAYDQQEYESAIKKFDIALKDPSSLKQKNVPIAWLYKGKSLISALQEASMNRDQQKQLKYQNAYLDAYECFINCVETDVDQKYQKEISHQMNILYSPLILAGQSYIEQNYYLIALKHLKAGLDINKKYIKGSLYNDHDLMGLAYLHMSDSTQALNSFKLAIEGFQKSPPNSPFVQVGYTYYYAALIERYQRNNTEASLQYIKEGMKASDQELNRLDEVKDKYTQQQIGAIKDRHSLVIDNLKKFELDLLLNAPEKMMQASEKFELALKKEPENTTTRLAYASLLEKSDPDKAIKQYSKVLKQDPLNYTANFNLGALYYNSAAEVYNQAMEAESIKEEAELSKKATKFFEESLPYFEKALESKPKDLSSIRTLKQLYSRLDMADKFQEMKKREEMIH